MWFAQPTHNQLLPHAAGLVACLPTNKGHGLLVLTPASGTGSVIR